MSIFKKILGAAAVIGAAALVLGTGGLAAPGAGLLFTSAGTLTFGARLGVSLLLSFAASRLMPKPNMPNYETTFRGRMLSVRQPVAPRELVYGFVRKGGTIIYIDSSQISGDTPALNRLDLVIVVASHSVRSIGNIYFNGEVAILAGDDRAIGTRWGDGSVDNTWAFATRHLGGTSGSQPFPTLASREPSKWTSAHTLKGVSAVHIELSFNPDLYPSGIPNITFDIEGKNDIHDPSTGLISYTNNAALCIADYLTNSPYGVGMTLGAEDGLNTDSVVLARSVSAQSVNNPGGGVESRYVCNGVVDLAQDKKSNIESMLSCMAGDLVYDNGEFRLFAGSYREPTQTIGPDDIRSAGLSMATRVSRSENFNGVRGQFIAPLNDWQPDDFPSYQSSAYVSEDNGQEAWEDISLPFTTSANAAQRIAKIRLERVRRQISVSVTCKLQGLKANAGDNILLNYPRWGFVNKPFYIKSRSLKLDGGSLVVDMELQETSPLVYESDATEFQIYAAAPRTNLPNGFLSTAPTDMIFVEEEFVPREGASPRNRLVISWSGATAIGIDYYEVQRRLGAGDWLEVGTSPIQQIVVEDMPNGTYDFRVRAVNTFGVRSPWYTESYTVVGFSEDTSLVGTSGYQQFNSGLILQWGVESVTTDSSGIGTITYPIPFPNNAYSIVFTSGDNSEGVINFSAISSTFGLTSCNFESTAISKTILVNYTVTGN